MNKVNFIYNAIAVSNYDGDTVTLDIDLGFGVWKRNEVCRLAKIDTPELRARDLQEKAVAYKAKAVVQRFLPPGQKCVVKTIKDDKGKYGRWLVFIYTDEMQEGMSINEYLLKNGYAKRLE
jgi:micrococcal nuclease